MRILYFTTHFPAGKAVNWKLFELEVLEKCVENITVVPFFFQPEFDENLHLPASIKVTAPLLGNYVPGKWAKMLLQILASRHRRFFVKEFFSSAVYANRDKFVNWLIDSHQMCYALNSSVLSELIAQNTKETLWYFYWGRNSALIIPYLRKKISAHIACRFHGYDLYRERNNGYIPYQHEVISRVDLLLPCSSDGYKYLQYNFQVDSRRMFVARLGTRFQGIARFAIGKPLNIVTCSFCVPVKRLEIIFEALEKLTIPFTWTHIGDGPLFNECLEKAARFNKEDRRIRFLGYLPSKSIIPFYLEEEFDVFLNVSASEGVPVSIMEALSVGLPVIATNVGGTGEIVDDEVGYLIEPSASSTTLAEILTKFSERSIERTQQYREAALKRFRMLCDSDQNAYKLIARLKDLVA